MLSASLILESFHLLVRKISYILTIGKNTIEFLFGSDNEFVKLTLPRTGRNQVSADNVFFQTSQ